MSVASDDEMHLIDMIKHDSDSKAHQILRNYIGNKVRPLARA